MSKGALGLLAAYWPEDTPRYAHVPLKLATELSLHHAAGEHGDATAIAGAGGATMTYADLSARVRRLAGALRGRLDKGSRVAVLVRDPVDLVACLLASTEARMCTYAADRPPSGELLAAFEPALIIGEAGGSGHSVMTVGDLSAGEEGDPPKGRPDFKGPVLVLPRPDGEGEVVHNQKTLGATAIVFESFYMLEPGARVGFLEPPTGWASIAFLLGTLRSGATAIMAWGDDPAPLGEKVDYVVCGWDFASRELLEDPRFPTATRIGAGAVVAVERGFSVSRRRRIGRRLRAPVLTLFGRSDVGPAIGSHPSWFLEDAAGIPLPNVDTRPLDPSGGQPLTIGWDAVEEAEMGIKSAMSPAGGDLVEGWLRSHRIGAIDPTGVYFLRRDIVPARTDLEGSR